jgi:hypothetical protein
MICARMNQVTAISSDDFERFYTFAFVILTISRWFVSGTVMLWSIGNHRIGHAGRAGINDAAVVQQSTENNICPIMKGKTDQYSGSIGTGTGSNERCSLWWVSTHYRIAAVFADEVPDQVFKYNLAMRDFFDDKKCGNVNYIDVYNMTARLSLEHAAEADLLSHDKAHWGFEVNLVKAKIIISALLSAN